MCESLSEIELEIERQLSKSEVGWYCTTCNYVNNSKATVKQHIETNHVISAGFECQICGKICPNRHALKMHKLRNKHSF